MTYIRGSRPARPAAGANGKPAYKPKSKPKKPKPARKPSVPLEVRELGPPADASVGVWVRDGLDRSIEDQAQKSWDERGRLRGGTVGVVLEDGRTSGRCVREGAARYLGADAPRDRVKWRDRRLMLDQGTVVEACFVDPLIQGLPPGWTAVRDWGMTGVIPGMGGPDIPWTGREDICLHDPSGTPRLLVELKNCSSLPTDLLFDEKPKTEHVIQLANYMMRSGLPGQLWYTSRVIWPIPSWSFTQALLPDSPRSVVPGAEYVEWSKPKWNGDQPTASKLTPFMIGFHFQWVDGVLWYTRALDMLGDAPTHWARTPVTAEGIHAWYGRVAEFLQSPTAELPAPPIPIELTGETKNYLACNYCDWSSVCAVARTRQDWVDLVINQARPYSQNASPGDATSKETVE